MQKSVFALGACAAFGFLVGALSLAKAQNANSASLRESVKGTLCWQMEQVLAADRVMSALEGGRLSFETERLPSDVLYDAWNGSELDQDDIPFFSDASDTNARDLNEMLLAYLDELGRVRGDLLRGNKGRRAYSLPPGGRHVLTLDALMSRGNAGMTGLEGFNGLEHESVRERLSGTISMLDPDAPLLGKLNRTEGNRFHELFAELCLDPNRIQETPKIKPECVKAQAMGTEVFWDTEFLQYDRTPWHGRTLQDIGDEILGYEAEFNAKYPNINLKLRCYVDLSHPDLSWRRFFDVTTFHLWLKPVDGGPRFEASRDFYGEPGKKLARYIYQRLECEGLEDRWRGSAPSMDVSLNDQQEKD